MEGEGRVVVLEEGGGREGEEWLEYDWGKKKWIIRKKERCEQTHVCDFVYF